MEEVKTYCRIHSVLTVHKHRNLSSTNQYSLSNKSTYWNNWHEHDAFFEAAQALEKLEIIERVTVAAVVLHAEPVVELTVVCAQKHRVNVGLTER